MRVRSFIFISALGVVFMSGLVRAYAVPVESEAKMRHVKGEIVLIDVKLGLLRLNHDGGQSAKGVNEYRINQEETRVTDPSDKKFLVIKDLRVGQHITLEYNDSSEGMIARKIIADPMPEPSYQETTGQLEAIDAQAGTFIIEEARLSGEGGKGDMSYFVFEPREVVVRKAPDMQPVQLELTPGDLVQVEYVVKDGKRRAHSITLLKEAPGARSTTTTTTTSTTVTE